VTASVSVSRPSPSLAAVWVDGKWVGELNQDRFIGEDDKIIYSVTPTPGSAIHEIVPGGLRSMSDEHVVAMVLRGIEHAIVVRRDEIKAWTKRLSEMEDAVKKLKGG